MLNRGGGGGGRGETVNRCENGKGFTVITITGSQVECRRA